MKKLFCAPLFSLVFASSPVTFSTMDIDSTESGFSSAVVNQTMELRTPLRNSNNLNNPPFKVKSVNTIRREFNPEPLSKRSLIINFNSLVQTPAQKSVSNNLNPIHASNSLISDAERAQLNEQGTNLFQDGFFDENNTTPRQDRFGVFKESAPVRRKIQASETIQIQNLGVKRKLTMFR
jgi:hypothetical protein